MTRDDTTAATPDAPLTVLADRYAVIKAEVTRSLRVRQEASRFGSEPALDDDRPGKQDARRIAAERLGAGVSYATLEKVLWLLEAAMGRERSPEVRQAARDAYDAVDAGESVSWPYERVRTLVLIDDLEQAADEAGEGTLTSLVAEHHARVLRTAGVYTATPMMKRQARQALKDVRPFDHDS